MQKYIREEDIDFEDNTYYGGDKETVKSQAKRRFDQVMNCIE